MNGQFPRLAAAALWLACTVADAAPPATSKTLAVKIDAQQTKAPVSNYIYGGFIEHGGTLIYRSLWSEMLDDRKFYFPISSKDTEPTASASNVGEQSPRVRLDPSNPRGIRQSGLTLVKGKKYTGRIYLRGTRGAKVTVSLIWSDGPNARHTITVGPLTDAVMRRDAARTSSDPNTRRHNV